MHQSVRLRPGGRCAGLASLLVLVSSGAIGLSGETLATTRVPHTESFTLRLGNQRYHVSLTNDQEFARLYDLAGRLLRQARQQRQEGATERTRLLDGRTLAELPLNELNAFHQEPADRLTGRHRRGLEQLQRLASHATGSFNSNLKQRCIAEIAEVIEALNLNRRPPIPDRIDVLELPLVHYDFAHNPIATGAGPAGNLEAAAPGLGEDLSRLNPVPSSFWRPPANLGALDLYHGFGRSRLPEMEAEILVYLEPKTGYGGHAGFVARCASGEVKVKFGEVHSEPFAARIFWALGYNVEATDWVPRLRVKYDRRLLREFNQRREVNTRISAFAVLPIYTLRFQPRHDPFQFIAAAVMKDGSRWSLAQLKSNLFWNPSLPCPEEEPANFRPDCERAIDYLVTVPANVQIKDASAKSIGPWAFGGLEHENRRELRGAGLLAAWIGWSDSRFDNNRLKVVATSEDVVLRHFISDLGGGLGRSTGLVYRQGERPNEFPWIFTRAQKVQGKGRMTVPFRVLDYQPIEDPPAFERMTMDDARWMGRWIGKLNERQMVEALIASGFDAAHVRLYLEKLVCRRDRMIRDLDLDGEISLLRSAGADRKLNFDPSREGPVTVKIADGRVVQAGVTQLVVRNGAAVPADGD